MRKELARNLFLAGCLIFDAVVIPETIFLLPSLIGWVVTIAGITLAVWLEYGFYRTHFSMPEPPETPP
jgi:hypothetical protein